MGYCNQHGVSCCNANPNGNCQITGCTRLAEFWNNGQGTQFQLQYLDPDRKCEICGKYTGNPDRHICQKCATNLYALLYDDNWGRG